MLKWDTFFYRQECGCSLYKMTMKNFLGGIKKAELKIIVAGESGNPEELIKSAISVTQFLEAKGFDAVIKFSYKQTEDWINEHKLGYVTINFEKYEQNENYFRDNV